VSPFRRISRQASSTEADMPWTRDILPYQRVAAAALVGAAVDLERTRPKSRDGACEWRKIRIQAACWLCSRAATLYFEARELDQVEALRTCGWARHAREILREHAQGKHRLEPEVARHLRRGLEAVEGRGDGRSTAA
jgi:hypothetical protein